MEAQGKAVEMDKRFFFAPGHSLGGLLLDVPRVQEEDVEPEAGLVRRLPEYIEQWDYRVFEP